MILEMGSAEQFSPTDSKRSGNHAELQTPCACVCVCVCVYSHLPGNQFLETG